MDTSAVPPSVADLSAWKSQARAGTAPADAVLRKEYAADQVKAEGDGSYLWTISTGSVDRDNDTIKVAGWHTDNFLKAGGPVLYAHNYSGLPVGKSPWVRAQGGALKARVQFAPEHVYAFAETVRRLVDFGAIRSSSVGFRPMPEKASWNETRGGVDFEEQDLLEFSIVPVPANPEALLDTAKGIAAAKKAGMDVAPIRSELMRALEAAEGTPGLYVPQSEWQKAIAVMSEPRVFTLGDFASEFTKRGRTLSAANENRIRTAADAASAIGAALDEVLAQVAQEEPEPKTALYVMPSKPKYSITVNPEAVKAAVRAAVSDSVQGAMSVARGRID